MTRFTRLKEIVVKKYQHKGDVMENHAKFIDQAGALRQAGLEIYGTFGPTCHEEQELEAMLQAGMNGIRLNLSHSPINAHKDWIDNLWNACKNSWKRCHLVMDLQGRERRLGKFASFELKKGDTILLPDNLPISTDVLICLEAGDEIHIGDSGAPLQILEKSGTSWKAQALADGVFEPGTSIHVVNKDSSLPVLYAKDLENLQIAKDCGVDGVLVPFVQTAADLKQIREIIEPLIPGCRLMAKIENMEGVRNLASILELADMIVIARGDLAASTSIEWLPTVQNYLEEQCRKAGKPYMVVTQMLDSMRSQPSPTRAEACDVFNAVKNGAAAIMLTGETAKSEYPVQAMETFCKIAGNACALQNDPNLIQDVIQTL